MEPKEKAIELVNKYLQIYDGRLQQAKQCALVAVNEILKSHNKLYGVNSKKIKYYLEVQQEIEKL